MTEREALLIALERLKEWVDHSDCLEDKQAISAIEETLAQPEQEPVVAGWLRIVQGHTGFVAAETEWGAEKPEKAGMWIPLYITPPQRKPLTVEMTKQMRERCDSYEMRGAFVDGWVSAEAAHGIKGEA